jgi:integrase
VRPTEVQAWVRSLATRLAPGTVEVVYRYLAAVFRSAVEDRVIAMSPCRGVKLPKIERVRVEPLTTEQVVAVADAVDDRYRALVILAAGTGLCQGEVFGLTSPRVDLLRRQVRVEQQLITVQGRAPFFAPPKTQASVRQVPLPTTVVDAVALHLAQFDPGSSGRSSAANAGSQYGATVSPSGCGARPSPGPDCDRGRRSTNCATSTRASSSGTANG